MRKLKTNWRDMDRRAGYQRTEHKGDWHCECGARVVPRFGELHHVGDCPIIKPTEKK
jgi:hypothetical protein